MKKQLLILTMILCVLGVQANGDKKAEAPKPLNYKDVISQVEYPKVCREKGIEGKVLVTLKIDENGKVINHKFEEYPCTDIRNAVKDVLSNFEFSPAKDEDGNAIKGKVTVPINFKLTI